MIEVKAPGPVPLLGRKIFLAGSIEMGAAEDWQQYAKERMKDWPVTLLNPRRDDWDSSWEQRASNPQFAEQVRWELAALEAADDILLHFDPETKAPISLLELGLFADSEKMVVSCPDGFWRKGNVEIVCSIHDVPLMNSLDRAIDFLKIA